MALSRRKFIAFATITALVPVIVLAAAMFALDLYLHRRAERSAGLNRWGYRGPIVGAKTPGELRIAVLGGSTAFGYGLPWAESPPAVLEEQLNARLHGNPRVSVVNLGFNNEGAYSYRFTLQDFAFLDYDIAYLYDGYNDMIGDSGPNTALYRHESAVFRLTGYCPILPLVLNEKAMAIRSGGQLNQAYAAARDEPGSKTVFKPGLADRTSASALESASAITESLGRQLGRLSPAPKPVTSTSTEAGCADPWSFYCQSMFLAIKEAIGHGKSVVVVLQPRLTGGAEPTHRDQQAATVAMLERHFSGAPVKYVDLSTAVNLHDRNYTFDGMHLSTDGTRLAMTALAGQSVTIVADFVATHPR